MSERTYGPATAFRDGDAWTVTVSTGAAAAHDADARALEAWVQWLAEQLGGTAAVGSTELRLPSEDDATRAAQALGWAAQQIAGGAQGFVLLGRAAASPLPASAQALETWLNTLVEADAAPSATVEPTAGVTAEDTQEQGAAPDAEGDPAPDAVGDPASDAEGDPAPDPSSDASPLPRAPAFDMPCEPTPDSTDDGRWSVFLAEPGPDSARTLRLLNIGLDACSAARSGSEAEALDRADAGALVLREASAPDVRRLHALVSTAAGAKLHLEREEA